MISENLNFSGSYVISNLLLKDDSIFVSHHYFVMNAQVSSVLKLLYELNIIFGGIGYHKNPSFQMAQLPKSILMV